MAWTNAKSIQYSPSAPLINPTTGAPINSGVYFFSALFNRTGAGTGVINQVNAIDQPIVAAGATINDAAALTNDWNVVTTSGPGQGVQLPSAMQPGTDIVIWNDGADSANVYPPSATALIDNLGAGTAYPLGAGDQILIRCWSTTQFKSAP